MRGIGKSCSPQTPPIFVRAIFRPRSSIWITNFSKKINQSMNIVRTDKNDQMHIKSWVMKLWFLCVGPECCLCSLRYLKCATASFQRFFLHSGTTTHKAPSHSDPAGYTGNALVCPRVRFKGTPPTSAKAKFTRVWPFLKRHIFIRIHVDVVRYTPVFSVVGQRSSPLTSVDWRL